jgi:hypothetical protein
MLGPPSQLQWRRRHLVSMLEPPPWLQWWHRHPCGTLLGHFDVHMNEYLSDSSTPTLKAPAYPLRLSPLHQRFRRYYAEISHPRSGPLDGRRLLKLVVPD